MQVSDTLLEQLYNKEVKEIFLEKYLVKDNTRETYTTSLIKTAKYEQQLNKDLYQFTKKEILQMFLDLKIESYSSIRKLFTVYKSYIDWSTKTELNKNYYDSFSNINFENEIVPRINFEGLKNKYITEDQLWDIIKKYSKNYQNIVCLVLSFYGIKGHRCKDMINLKIEDINNKMGIIHIGKSREVEVPDTVIQVINKAINQKEYEFREGFKFDLVNTKYIIRPSSNSRQNNEQQISYQTIGDRCKGILSNAGYTKLSINDINTSGKLHLLNQLRNKGEYVGIDDYKKVLELFGESSINYNNLKRLFEIIYMNNTRQLPNENKRISKFSKIKNDRFKKRKDLISKNKKLYNNEPNNNSIIDDKIILSQTHNIIKYIKLKQRLISENNILKLGLTTEENIKNLKNKIQELKNTFDSEELKEVTYIDKIL